MIDFKTISLKNFQDFVGRACMSVFFVAASFYCCHFRQCLFLIDEVVSTDRKRTVQNYADLFYKDTYIQIFIVSKSGHGLLDVRYERIVTPSGVSPKVATPQTCFRSD